ncbi:MAG: alpha/beta hydrolase [Patescibacteria group bacterium]
MDLTILFLHGMFSWGRCFKFLADNISEKFPNADIICPTLPYHETSIDEEPDDHLGPFRIEDAIAHLQHEFIEKIDGQIIIIGHSLGALIGEILASKNQKIERIILINPAPQFGVNGFSWSALLNYLPIILRPGWENKPIRRTPRQTIRAIGHNLPPDIKNRIVSGARWASGSMLSQLMEKDPITSVHGLTCDINMIYCGKDRMVTPRVSRAIALGLGTTPEFLPELPHYPLHDQYLAEKICAIIKSHHSKRIGVLA